MKAKFGSSGNPDDFYARGYKHSVQMPEYLHSMNLDVYEYQCGRGVKIKEETAKELRAEAQKHGIMITLHSPYFISLSTTDESKIEGNIRYITESAEAINLLGGERVVVHSGSCGKTSREEALAASRANLLRAQRELDERGLSHIRLCPETMGKINQLGTLEEVLELCRLDERFLPCLDFGHLNARTLGGCQTAEQFAVVLDKTENVLGRERASRFHAHFSKIEYSAGGEVRHLTFSDEVFGPSFEPLAELIAKRGYAPVILSESAGTQSFDAVTMKRMVQEAEA